MKHTLAENMLRFGVKNLSESDLRKLQEQLEEPKTKTPAQKVEQMFNVKTSAGKAVGSVKALLPLTNGKAGVPLDITINYPDVMNKLNLFKLRLFNNTTYKLDTAYGSGKDFSEEWIVNSGGSILAPKKPLTAINDVIASINKQTGSNVSLDPKITQTLNTAESGVRKSVDVQLTAKDVRLSTGVLIPYKFARLSVVYDPETNKELYRRFTFGPNEILVSLTGDKVTKIQGLMNDLIKTQPEEVAGLNSREILPDVQSAYNAAVAKLK